jgi:hypothetical protein
MAGVGLSVTPYGLVSVSGTDALGRRHAPMAGGHPLGHGYSGMLGVNPEFFIVPPIPIPFPPHLLPPIPVPDEILDIVTSATTSVWNQSHCHILDIDIRQKGEDATGGKWDGYNWPQEAYLAPISKTGPVDVTAVRDLDPDDPESGVFVPLPSRKRHTGVYFEIWITYTGNWDLCSSTFSALVTVETFTTDQEPVPDASGSNVQKEGTDPVGPGPALNSSGEYRGPIASKTETGEEKNTRKYADFVGPVIKVGLLDKNVYVHVFGEIEVEASGGGFCPHGGTTLKEPIDQWSPFKPPWVK